MGIKMIKEKKAMNYTFTGDSLDLGKLQIKSESGNSENKSLEPDYRLRDTAKISKVRGKSKVTGGGHSTHSHSPVYE